MITPAIGQTAFDNIQRLIQEVEKVVKGKRPEIELILTALLAQGHVLIEDNPGSGKTVTARAIASAISDKSGIATFKRVQFTPDLLPMDIIGAHIFDERNVDFIFKKGPIFTNILLADEINRASPKVQSALLESMAEQQITVGDHTYPLEDLFFVIATQNPIETEGTYPLPAAQLDRFAMKILYGYVDAASEKHILQSYNNIAYNLHHIQPVLDIDAIVLLQQHSDEVYIHDAIVDSVLAIVQATRADKNILVGASTRAAISFIKCLKAYALIQGRAYVIESDVERLAHTCLHHRLVFRNAIGKQEALANIIQHEVKLLSNKHISQHAS